MASAGDARFVMAASAASASAGLLARSAVRIDETSSSAWRLVIAASAASASAGLLARSAVRMEETSSSAGWAGECQFWGLGWVGGKGEEEEEEVMDGDVLVAPKTMLEKGG